MDSFKKALSDELLSWPGVVTQPHRFGGVEFNCNGREIGHLHAETVLDLLFPKDIRNELVESGRAKPHHIYPESGWVTFYIRKKEDIHEAIELCRIKYDRIWLKTKE